MTSVEDKLINPNEEELVLTTTDNPFNPKTDYEKWRSWDFNAGYNTEAYLARVMNLPLDVDLEDDALIGLFTNEAIKSILDEDSSGLYVLVE